jgi:hypothetical protein
MSPYFFKKNHIYRSPRQYIFSITSCFWRKHYTSLCFHPSLRRGSRDDVALERGEAGARQVLSSSAVGLRRADSLRRPESAKGARSLGDVIDAGADAWTELTLKSIAAPIYHMAPTQGIQPCPVAAALIFSYDCISLVMGHVISCYTCGLARSIESCVLFIVLFVLQYCTI